MKDVLVVMAGLTVTGIGLYFFFHDGDQSSKVIRSLASGYSEVITAFQGRGGSYFS